MSIKEASGVRSMTGFARATASENGFDLEVELRSVNHRFLEVTFKAPRVYAQFEREFKGVVQRHHRRGRIDVTVVRRTTPALTATPALTGCGPIGAAPAVELPGDAALDFAVSLYTRACKKYGVTGDHLGAFLAQAVLKDARQTEDPVAVGDEEIAALTKALEQGSDALFQMRTTEGEALVREVAHRVRTIETLRDVIVEAAVDLPRRFKERLEDRLRALAADIPVDAQRLATEVAFLAERSDITEEITRIGSHVEQFRASLGGDPEGVGRKLDFLVQELGREFNTIGSKAQDAKVQGVVVDAKAELEKIREQVQNIE
jgi:uncharacterized protein YicC (UPF0701 family)